MVVAIVLDDDMAMTMAMAATMAATMMMVAGQSLVPSLLLVPGLIPIGIDVECLRYGDDKLVAVFSIPSSDLLPSPNLMD